MVLLVYHLLVHGVILGCLCVFVLLCCFMSCLPWFWLFDVFYGLFSRGVSVLSIQAVYLFLAMLFYRLLILLWFDMLIFAVTNLLPVHTSHHLRAATLGMLGACNLGLAWHIWHPGHSGAVGVDLWVVPHTTPTWRCSHQIRKIEPRAERGQLCKKVAAQTLHGWVGDGILTNADCVIVEWHSHHNSGCQVIPAICKLPLHLISVPDKGADLVGTGRRNIFNFMTSRFHHCTMSLNKIWFHG